MNTQSIKREDLATLYNMSGVCDEWKTKIKSYLKNDLFSNKIEVAEEDIEAALNAANREQQKAVLKYFKRPKLLEEISDWKSILKILKTSEKDLQLILNPKTKEDQSRNDYARLLCVAKAYNKEWKPNWKDTSESKWYVYLYYSGGRWVVYVDDSSYNVFRPSGVYFKTKEAALDSYKKFEKIYKGYFMID